MILFNQDRESKKEVSEAQAEARQMQAALGKAEDAHRQAEEAAKNAANKLEAEKRWADYAIILWLL